MFSFDHITHEHETKSSTCRKVLKGKWEENSLTISIDYGKLNLQLKKFQKIAMVLLAPRDYALKNKKLHFNSLVLSLFE